MSHNNEENSVLLDFLAGIGIGAIIGAATALLLAPKPGAETREDLKGAIDDLKVRANKVVDELSTATDDLVKKSRDLLDTTKSRIQNAVESGRQAMAQKQQDISKETAGEQES